MNLLSTYMRSRGDYSPSLLNRTGPGGVRADAGLSDRPLHEYLDEDELPHYVLEASGTPRIERAGEPIEHETGNYATFVVATDDRIICLAGGPDGDTTVTIPYSELTDIEAETRRKMVSKTTEVTVRGEHASVTFETDQRNAVPAVRAYVGEQIAEHYLEEAEERRKASQERQEGLDLEDAEVDLTDASYAVTQVLELAPNGSAVRERAEELSEDLENDAYSLSRAKNAATYLEEMEDALSGVESAARAGDYDAIPEYHDKAEQALEEAMNSLDPADTFTKTVAQEREALREQEAQLVGVEDFEGLLGTLEEAREAHDRYEVAMDDGDLDGALEALQAARENYESYVDALPQTTEPSEEGCVRCDERPAAFDIETPNGQESVCLPCTAFDEDGALPTGEEVEQRLAALPDVDALPESLPDDEAAEPDAEPADEDANTESAAEPDVDPEQATEANADVESESTADVEESPWTAEEQVMLDELHELQNGRGELLRAHDLREHGEYSAQDYIATFGSWDDALAAAGIDKEARLLGELQRVTDALGHLPTKLEMSRHGQYSANMYERFFGDWEAAQTRLNEWHTARTTADESAESAESADETETATEHESTGDVEIESAESEVDAETAEERGVSVENAENADDTDTEESAVEIETAESVTEDAEESGQSPTEETESGDEEPVDVEVVKQEPVHPEPSGGRPSTDAAADDPVTVDVAEPTNTVSDGGTAAASADADADATTTETADATADEDAERERMKDQLRALEEEQGCVPSRDDVVVGCDDSLLRYERVFGSLEEALDEAGIDREARFTEDIEAVGEELGTLPSRQQFARYGEHGISQVVEFFDSWEDAIDSTFGESN